MDLSPIDRLDRRSPEHARAVLRAWLEELGVNQTWLAKQMDVSAATASRWISDMNPRRHREALEILTGGRVLAHWWRTRDEWRRIEKAYRARAALERAQAA